jgi:yeast amino acid transporter
VHSLLGTSAFERLSEVIRGSICLAHIRFRQAWIAQGNQLDDLPFKAAAGVYGSWIGLSLNVLCLIAQFYIALFPIGSMPNASTFFRGYLAAPVVLLLFCSWKVLKKTRYVRAKEADLLSGRRLMNLHKLRAEDLEKQSNWGPMKKYDSIFESTNSQGLLLALLVKLLER